MPLPRRRFYGWHDPDRNEYRLSDWPPDAPVRPSSGFDTEEELAAYLKRRRGVVDWFPPLAIDRDRAVNVALARSG